MKSLSLLEARLLIDVKEDTSSPPPINVLPSSKPLKVNAQINFTTPQFTAEVPNNTTSSSAHTCENPFPALIVHSKWLTTTDSSPQQNEQWSESRNVISVTFSLKSSGITHHPGDSIGLFAPNPTEIVESVLQLLRTAHNREDLTLDTTVNSSGLPQGSQCVRSHEQTVTIGELLYYRVDLVGPPKKLLLMPLVEHCTDPYEKCALQWLISKGETGKRLWTEFVEKQGLGIAELLLSIPSCQPTLPALIACCLPAQPRYYSICSSPLAHPDTVNIAVSLERFTCQMQPTASRPILSTNLEGQKELSTASNPASVIETMTPNHSLTHESNKNSPPALNIPIYYRTGLCTNYLHQLCHKWLYIDSAQQQPQLSTLVITDSSSDSLGNKLARINLSGDATHGRSEDSLTPNSTTINITSPTSYSIQTAVRLFHKPTVTFHLPGSVGPPLILIGPGTGVAPFIGFLEHRQNLESQRRHCLSSAMVTGTWRGCFELAEKDLPAEENQVGSFIGQIAPGPIHLFFGCRDEKDFLYRDELEGFLRAGTLTTLDVAMSRKSGSEKEYVQDRLRLRGNEICDLLMHHGACVYVCGDGTRMAKDVQKELTEILQAHGELEADQAAEFVDDLKIRRRYLVDIWG